MHDLVLNCMKHPLPAACGAPQKGGGSCIPPPLKAPPSLGTPQQRGPSSTMQSGGCSWVDPGVPLLLCIAPSWAWGGCRAGWGYPSPKVARSWLWFFFFLARGASQMFCMMLNASSPILKSPPPPGGMPPALGELGVPCVPAAPGMAGWDAPGQGSATAAFGLSISII